MKVLVDANIILDVLCTRIDFLDISKRIWELCETGKVSGIISALSVPNIIYVMRKELTPDGIEETVKKLKLVFEILDLTISDMEIAAEMRSRDFEDAIQITAAQRAGADFIVTRNIRDFADSKITALKPEELLERI